MQRQKVCVILPFMFVHVLKPFNFARMLMENWLWIQQNIVIKMGLCLHSVLFTVSLTQLCVNRFISTSVGRAAQNPFIFIFSTNVEVYNPLIKYVIPLEHKIQRVLQFSGYQIFFPIFKQEEIEKDILVHSKSSPSNK